MTRNGRRALILLGNTLIALAAASCRSEPVDTSKVFATRTLALAYLQRGQLAEAEAEFKKVIELVPDDRLGYANLGLTYLQAGRFKDAEPVLLRARELDPGNADIGLMLARLYTLTARPKDAQAALDALRSDTTNVRVLYALAELEKARTDAASQRRYEDRLRAVLAAAPANLAVRIDLVSLLAQQSLGDSVVRHLEEVRRIPPSLPPDLRATLDTAMSALQDGKAAQAKAPLDRFLAQIRVTTPYQAALDEIRSGASDSPLVGRPVLTFAPTSLIVNGVRETATVDSVQFRDVVEEAGLFDTQVRAAAGAPAAPATAIASGDVDGDGAEDLFVSFPAATHEQPAHIYLVRAGFARDITPTAGVVLRDGARFATFADVDNDGWLDLFVIGGDGRGHLFHNRGDKRFDDVTARAAIGDVRGARSALFADVDHDGDVDLVLTGNGPATVYRNNLDGTFSDATAAYGLTGDAVTSDAAFGDFDSDGRIDLFVSSPAGVGRLFRNAGAQRFSDASAASGVTGSGGSGAVAVGDYNNDGMLDLFVAGANGGAPVLRRGKGTPDSTFTPDRRSSAVLQLLGGVDAVRAAFVDYDNDGWQDLLVVGTARAQGKPGLFLFRNDRRGQFLDRSSLIPAAVRAAGAAALVVFDSDADGDEDVLVTDVAGALHLLGNDGGNSNMALNVGLKGLRTGSGKNNAFGIGARLELRAGDIYQSRVVTGSATHFGLGQHLKADVLRVEWPNGVPQTLYFPGGDRDVVESELLKGSCAFAYTWDGTRFRFVTDVMWRSALGMPMGLMGTNARFAPAGASQEYLRIPGSALKPRNGKYVMQLTEELWETAYADEVKLIAVDHPDSVDVFVDERFVPPGPVSMRLYQVGRADRLVRATDQRGVNLLETLRESDSRYVDNFTPTQYQGVVNMHDLVLDLGPSAGQPGMYLFLKGWIYPTDASINVALSQQNALKIASPSLEVIDAKGRWTTVIPDIGFPSGKDKTVIVDLAGKFPTADHRVRIRTNMQIYWDEAFVARDERQGTVKVTTLAPVSANLHSRGFSRMFRKGGRHGPFWFAYDDVTKQSPWRPIEGAFTRFGDVLPLLTKSDDMYIVMGPGDETTIEFDASGADSLPKGWTRDFLLYSDGWIKDSDLNTAFGTSVGPLPFHAIKQYPYAPGESYPTDAAHQAYLREYQTRRVGRRSDLRASAKP